jgi:hypothetical protein
MASPRCQIGRVVRVVLFSDSELWGNQFLHHFPKFSRERKHFPVLTRPECFDQAAIAQFFPPFAEEGGIAPRIDTWRIHRGKNFSESLWSFAMFVELKTRQQYPICRFQADELPGGDPISNYARTDPDPPGHICDEIERAEQCVPFIGWQSRGRVHGPLQQIPQVPTPYRRPLFGKPTNPRIVQPSGILMLRIGRVSLSTIKPRELRHMVFVRVQECTLPGG